MHPHTCYIEWVGVVSVEGVAGVCVCVRVCTCVCMCVCVHSKGSILL